MKCRLCGRTANEIQGYLHRVNEKGVAGIWECRPICGAEMNQDDALIAAIEGAFDSPKAEGDTVPGVSEKVQRCAELIVPDCLSRTCFIEACHHDQCWGCDDQEAERKRVAAIITEEFQRGEDK